MVATLDLAIIGIYIAALFFINVFIVRSRNLEEYLVNNRKTKLLLLVLTIVSTNVGAGFFLSVASESYTTGISFGVTIAIISVISFVFLSIFSSRIKKFGDENKAYTLPQFFASAYKSNPNRFLVAGIILLAYVFLTALQLVGVGAIASTIFEIDLTTIILVVGLATIVYTAIAGFKGDIITDAISFIITVLILGIILVPIFLTSSTLDLPENFYNVFEFGGPEFLIFGIIFGSIAAILQMELWQRLYSAESAKTARKALLISAGVQVPFIILATFLGLAATSILPDLDKNVALFALMKEVLPVGIFGLGLVALLAIIMDTVNSLILVGSSILINDFYRVFKKTFQERNLLRLARILTLIFGLVALAIAYLIPDVVRLLLIGGFMILPIAPPLLARFLWKNLSAKASFVSILVGFIVTIVFIPSMPKTAFIPGFLTSLFIFAGWSLVLKFLKK